MVRGSSIMKLISWRSTPWNTRSDSSSRRASATAARGSSCSSAPIAGAQHVLHDGRHAPHLDGARLRRLAVGEDLARLQRDLLRLVADPLQVGGDADHRQHVAQVARRRLAPRDDLAGELVDRALERVDHRLVRAGSG